MRYTMEDSASKFNGELWIPRTPWEKRRQLSAVIQRSLGLGRRIVILSCDGRTTFLSRIDVATDLIGTALIAGQVEYMQIPRTSGSDLSRILGHIGQKFHGEQSDLVIMDDVDLMIDLGSGDALQASMFALLYALKTRFREMALFCNPLHAEWEMHQLSRMEDYLTVHHPLTRNVA